MPLSMSTAAHGGQIACEEGLAVHVIQRLEQAELELADDADLALDFPRSGGGQRDGVSPRALQPASLPARSSTEPVSLSEFEVSGDASLAIAAMRAGSVEGEVLVRGGTLHSSGELGGGISPPASASSTARISGIMLSGSVEPAEPGRVPPISGPVSGPSTARLSEMLRDSSGSADPTGHCKVPPDSAPESQGVGTEEAGGSQQLPHHPALQIQRSSQSLPHNQRQVPPPYIDTTAGSAAVVITTGGSMGSAGGRQPQQPTCCWKLPAASIVDGVKVQVTALRMGDFRWELSEHLTVCGRMCSLASFLFMCPCVQVTCFEL